MASEDEPGIVETMKVDMQKASTVSELEEWSSEVNGLFKDKIITTKQLGELKGEIIRIKGMWKDVEKLLDESNLEEMLGDLDDLGD